MKKLWNRRGEMLVESLISMLIIAMTGMMLAMAAASALQANAQASQTVTFASVSGGDVTVGTCNAVLADTDTGNSVADINIGSVTVKEQGGLYYYETN